MTPILVGVTVVLAAVVLCVLMAKLDRETFEERYPPISDAEFLARCPPGTDPKVALKVRRIVADYFDIEYERVHPSLRFIEDLSD